MYRSEEDDDNDVLEDMKLSDLVPSLYEKASLTLVASKMMKTLKPLSLKMLKWLMILMFFK